MLKLRLTKSIQILAVVCTLAITSCGGGEPEPTSTLSPDEIKTLAVETFSAALTQTARAAPSNTPVSTLTAPATFQPFTASTGSVPFGPTTAATSSVTACYRLLFVTDVSIPDNTVMAPGQAFTKTWKVRNTGTCPWDAGFKFIFISGEAMNGSTYTLAAPVAPNAELDISVTMVAPTNKTGTLRGDWQMSTAGGQLFGQSVFVQIIVGGVTGTPSTRTPTATSTVTSTSVPAVVTSTPTATETPTSTPTP